MDFSVFKYLDEALIKDEMGTPYASKTPAVWPSEASAERLDKSLFNIVGKCHRQGFMRMTGFSVTHPPDATSAWKWVLGREIETNLTNQARLAGLFAACGVKHFIRDIILSCEFDVIGVAPESKRGVVMECKSYSGYHAKKEILTKNKPKADNIIQLCLYILEIRTGARMKEMVRKGLEDRKRLDEKVRQMAEIGKVFEHRHRIEADLAMLDTMDDGPIMGKLLYVDRGDADRKEFTIEVMQDFDGFHYPVVDGIPFKIFTLESVYSRYKTLQGYWFRARSQAAQQLADRGVLPPPSLQMILCVQDVLAAENTATEKKTPEEYEAEAKYLSLLELEVRSLPSSFWPPAEYEWSYSPERIEQLFAAGQIGKGKYEDYKKDKITRLGDWQCSYCPVRGHCLQAEKPEMAYLISDLLNDMTAEVEIG